MKKQPQPIQTSIQCKRPQNQNIESFVRVDTFEDGQTSTLIMQHQKQDKKEFLEINARDFSGLLTNSTITGCMHEMNKGLRASNITNLKLVGLTDKNCEADLFRRQFDGFYLDGSFSNIKEVVIESGYTPEEMAENNIQPSILPAKPFMKSELSFIKFDGLQIIPPNFLANIFSVENIICPDNQNTHEFLEPFKQEQYINVINPDAPDTTQNTCTPSEQ